MEARKMALIMMTHADGKKEQKDMKIEKEIRLRNSNENKRLDRILKEHLESTGKRIK